MKITIVNGPNLNLLGVREPEKYGCLSFDEYLVQLRKNYPDVEISCFQSNIEGEIVGRLQQDGFTADGILLNAGGYSHTSVAIADAVSAVPAPVVEVHITNIYAREPERRFSLISRACCGVISGFGLDSYRLAIDYFVGLQPVRQTTPAKTIPA